MEEIKMEQTNQKKMLLQLLQRKRPYEEVQTVSFDFLPLETDLVLMDFERKLTDISFSQEFVSSPLVYTICITYSV